MGYCSNACLCSTLEHALQVGRPNVLGGLPIDVERLHKDRFVVLADELLVHVEFVGECDAGLLYVD